MKEFVEKIKPYTILVGWVITILGSLWMIFGVYDRLNDNLKVIQKSTLRNTIWNETVPMHDRLESCDSYLKLGYNSETKKYCNKLLEK